MSKADMTETGKDLICKTNGLTFNLSYRFVKVHWDNILEGYKSNFEKQSLKNTSYSFEYDFLSIMHYGKYYFSKEKGKPTLTPKVPNYHIGQRKQMSVTDCLKINDLYGCLEDKGQRSKYYNRCKTFGL